MDTLPLRYSIALQGRDYDARIVLGQETVNTWSSIEARFSIPARDQLDPDDLVGTSAILRMSRGEPEREIHLVVAEIERGAAPNARDRDYGADVRVVLESRLGRLRYRKDIRVFRDHDYPTIAQEVIAQHGISVTRSLSRGYPKRPYTVQYRETDLAFVSRLLADEGIAYFVRDDGGVELFDTSAAYEALGAIPFRQLAGLPAKEDAVFEIGSRGKLGPSSLTLADFDFERPSSPVSAAASTGGAGGSEWYDFPARRTSGAETGGKVGGLKEALSANRRRVCGKTTAARFRVCGLIDIENGPEGFAVGATAIASVSHDFDNERGDAWVAFTGVASDVTLRPEPTASWPRIAGPLPGFVTGDGDDIHTDEWGRVKIHFPWDRLQPMNGSCSHWIPTLQDNTGHSVAIPRVGWEMMLHFVEGNPDEPVILGRVFNPLDPFYTLLPSNKTQISLRSLTSPFDPTDPRPNSIQIDDRKGRETITMEASKDRNVIVAHDKTELTAVEDKRDIGRHERVRVGVDRSVTVTATSAMNISGNQTVTIGHDHHRTIDKGSADNINQCHDITIGSSHTRRIEETDSVTVKEVLSERIGAALIEASVRENNRDASLVAATLVGGATIDIAKGTVSHASGADRLDVTGILRMTKAGGRISKACAADRTTNVGATFTAKAGTFASISGQDELEMTAGRATFTGKEKVTLKVGETSIVLEKGEIRFETKGAISIHSEARSNIKTGKTKQI